MPEACLRHDPRAPVVPKARVSDATGTPTRPSVFLESKGGVFEGCPVVSKTRPGMTSGL